MKRKMALAGLMVIAGVMLAAAQSTAPKDPQLIDIQGYQNILDQYKGKPLLVTFWATWCEPCRDEYPMLNELAKQYAPRGLKVVGIDLDQDGDLILMRRFLARYKPQKEGRGKCLFTGRHARVEWRDPRFVFLCKGRHADRAPGRRQQPGDVRRGDSHAPLQVD